MTTTFRLPASAGKYDNILAVAAGTSVAITDLTLDGNRTNRGAYESSELESSSLIDVAGTATIDRVTCRDSTGDGVTLQAGADVTINDLTAIDCFRGGLTLVAGPASCTVDNYQGSGDTHPSFVQIENTNTDPISLTITNSTVPMVELEAWGVVSVSDSDITSGLWVNGQGGASVGLTDCTIGLSSAVQTYYRKLYWARDVTFTRCHFTGETLELFPMGPDSFGETYAGQHVQFIDCTFTGAGPGSGPAVYNYGDDIDRGNQVTFSGCTYTGFDAGYAIRLGYFATVNGTIAPA